MADGAVSSCVGIGVSEESGEYLQREKEEERMYKPILVLQRGSICRGTQPSWYGDLNQRKAVLLLQ